MSHAVRQRWHKRPFRLAICNWHKLSVYSHCRKAPFIENYSSNHFFIAWDDTVLSAQMMETAAWLFGIGSCFVGHVMDCTDELKNIYHLPDLTFPVILLSMGYPRKTVPQQPKLSMDMMVFEGEYPSLTEQEICIAYDQKYKERKLFLSENEEVRKEKIEKFRRALETTYTNAEADAIICDLLEKGYFTEIQRLFGLHYHPDREIGNRIFKDIYKQKLYPLSSSIVPEPKFYE